MSLVNHGRKARIHEMVVVGPIPEPHMQGKIFLRAGNDEPEKIVGPLKPEPWIPVLGSE